MGKSTLVLVPHNPEDRQITPAQRKLEARFAEEFKRRVEEQKNDPSADCAGSR